MHTKTKNKLDVFYVTTYSYKNIWVKLTSKILTFNSQKITSYINSNM